MPVPKLSHEGLDVKFYMEPAAGKEENLGKEKRDPCENVEGFLPTELEFHTAGSADRRLEYTAHLLISMTHFSRLEQGLGR
ncbi:hypothetical protein N7493_009086 [Penicillium malachiteum]|uniref:Uncharacterized protein n=1 Tax=Penicillium malachiteum TaxID=1324776 RepID=A0AAD6HFW9_9EURO|nr:hypothetical protein N7493_009086 [Penicillium malachiteum]